MATDTTVYAVLKTSETMTDSTTNKDGQTGVSRNVVEANTRQTIAQKKRQFKHAVGAITDSGTVTDIN